MSKLYNKEVRYTVLHRISHQASEGIAASLMVNPTYGPIEQMIQAAIIMGAEVYKQRPDLYEALWADMQADDPAYNETMLYIVERFFVGLEEEWKRRGVVVPVDYDTWAKEAVADVEALLAPPIINDSE